MINERTKYDRTSNTTVHTNKTTNYDTEAISYCRGRHDDAGLRFADNTGTGKRQESLRQGVHRLHGRHHHTCRNAQAARRRGPAVPLGSH